MIPYPLILRFLRRGLWIILLCGLISTLFGFYFSSKQTPIYRSTASFLVSPASNNEESIDFGDVVYGIDTLSRRNTVATYAEVFGSERVFDVAAQMLNIPPAQQGEYTYNAVVLPETSIIRVTSEGPDPNNTTDMVTIMSNQASDIMKELYNAYEITALDVAKIPEQPIRPNVPQDTALASIIGLLLGISIAIIRTPEIVIGRPDQHLAPRGIVGNVPFEPISGSQTIELNTPITPSSRVLGQSRPTKSINSPNGNYQFESSEQMVSRFLPNLLGYRALNKVGKENRKVRANLEKQLMVSIRWLVARQNEDGGWGYWPNEESTLFTTTYVYWGLRHAMNYSFGVPQRSLDAAYDYLLRGLFVESRDVHETGQLNEMAFLHLVLAETGMGDAHRMSALYGEQERMQLYGRALLAMALAEVDRDDPRIHTLLDDLAINATVTANGAYWSEKNADYRTLNTDIRTSATALAALSRLRPSDPLIPMAVHWLLDARQASRWPNTQENAWALIALTDWLSACGKIDGNSSWFALLNGEELDHYEIDAGLMVNNSNGAHSNGIHSNGIHSNGIHSNGTNSNGTVKNHSVAL